MSTTQRKDTHTQIHVKELMQAKHTEVVKQLQDTVNMLWQPVDTLFNADFSLVAFLSGITV